MTKTHEATIGPCGPRPRPPCPAAGGAPAGGAGAGPRSGWKRYTLCVFGSTAIVFAPAKQAVGRNAFYLPFFAPRLPDSPKESPGVFRRVTPNSQLPVRAFTRSPSVSRFG